MSTNVSKKQHAALLEKFAKIKDFIMKHSIDPEVLASLSDIEQYISTPRYGLVFETHAEEHDASSSSEATLIEIADLSIDQGGQEHLLIEGENLIVLKILERQYARKINVICIDPPYNTGNKGLKYNDTDYMDTSDAFSHSKWLSFMFNRLVIAKRLLAANGVMFINSDETQIGCLIVLCEQMFGDKNVTVMVWPKTDVKFDKNRVEKPVINVKMAHEYVILCYNDKSITHFNKMMRRPLNSSLESAEMPFDAETILNELGTTSSAKDEICELFGSRDAFSTPKPRKLLKELIRIAAGPDALVLDFFAGSGTTGHAVMELNQEDKGHRIFILVTNNENNICRNITYERIKRAIHFHKYKESLKYLRVV